MDNRFLITFDYGTEEGKMGSTYNWFESEEEMRKGIEGLKTIYKTFEVIEVLEVIASREVEL